MQKYSLKCPECGSENITRQETHWIEFHVILDKDGREVEGIEQFWDERDTEKTYYVCEDCGHGDDNPLELSNFIHSEEVHEESGAK